MEFKYRAVDERPTPTSHPLSTITYVSERSLRGNAFLQHTRLLCCMSMAEKTKLFSVKGILFTIHFLGFEFTPGGFSGDVPAPKIFRMPVPVNAGEALRRELEKEHIRREIEKEQIRREIVAGEIAVARRRELEEEVRRELALERGLRMPIQRNLVASTEGFSLQERVSVCLNPRGSPVDSIYGVSQPQLPRILGPTEIKPSPQSNKDKLIILKKPEPNVFGAKRKAATPPAVDGREHSPFSLQKKPKEEWSCALCQVSATSERGLNDHLQGKKHKAKEAALRTPKIGLDARADMEPFQPCITRADINHTTVDKGVMEPKIVEQPVQKSQDIGGLENENGTATGKEAGKINASTMKKLKFWCDICQVGTRSEIVMQSHKIGKKHLIRMKKFRQNNGSAPFTSSIPPEAPVLVKDMHGVSSETD
ncbi:hypothetical protein VNO77_24099 [Canavalia gladiata]|uniref:Zinc finger protein 385D n=1 Tax=Canavalia gladiata TaxID=3824 RepID=A0AAN9L849_CANGL